MSGGIEDMHREERVKNHYPYSNVSAKDVNDLYAVRKELLTLANKVEMIINHRLWGTNNGS